MTSGQVATLWNEEQATSLVLDVIWCGTGAGRKSERLRSLKEIEGREVVRLERQSSGSVASAFVEELRSTKVTHDLGWML
jgi:hypothetical protein